MRLFSISRDDVIKGNTMCTGHNFFLQRYVTDKGNTQSARVLHFYQQRNVITKATYKLKGPHFY